MVQTAESCQSFQEISLASGLLGKCNGRPGGLSAGCCQQATSAMKVM